MPRRHFPFATTEQSAERFAQWVADPGPGAPSKQAATVILLRDAEAGVEVFVQRRVSSMAFAPNRVVFPGGSVDPGDAQPLPMTGPPLTQWAEVMQAPEPDAQALISAAIRELFEETGVLLATPRQEGASWDIAGQPGARARLLAREAGLGALLAEFDLVARTDLLGYVAHWITPEVEPRRYDTHFFAALLPAGQEADAQTSEAASAGWARPEVLLRDHAAELMPPTVVCLESLAAASSAHEVVSVRSPVPVVQPIPVPFEGGWAMQAELP